MPIICKVLKCMVIVALFLYVSIYFAVDTFKDFYGHKWFHWFLSSLSYSFCSLVLFLSRPWSPAVSQILHVFVMINSLPPFELYIQLLIPDQNKWWINLFISLIHVCYSMYYFTSVIIACSYASLQTGY